MNEENLISEEEKQVLKALRNGAFSAINIIKTNGKIDIIEGLEKIRDNDKVKEILRQHSYQNIEIIQAKNQIVHINRKVRIKAKV